MMLVIAQNIAEANELEAILTRPELRRRRVRREGADGPLRRARRGACGARQARRPDSPYRIVVSVGMLKEGWDNKAVYVIASMRASVSTILTEQTLGRGLRLPFGAVHRTSRFSTRSKCSPMSATRSCSRRPGSSTRRSSTAARVRC